MTITPPKRASPQKANAARIFLPIEIFISYPSPPQRTPFHTQMQSLAINYLPEIEEAPPWMGGAFSIQFQGNCRSTRLRSCSVALSSIG
jgi:hypothetical protein